MNCCFVGHQHIRITRALERTVKKELKALIEKGYTEFYSGGAYGFDAMCSIIILKLRKKYEIKLNLILPCHATAYTAKWELEHRVLFHRIMAAADNVELAEKANGSDLLWARNKTLIDKADILFCFYDKNRSGSPTERVIYTASQKGTKIINICSGGGFND